MAAPRALRLLAPLARVRRASTCSDQSAPPPCPPCDPTPPPPCRVRHKPPLAGRRVVCCPPPQGARPPCETPPPECALTCENNVQQSPPPQPVQGEHNLCGAARDVVAQRLREHDEHRRRQYERAVTERLARPPAPPPSGHCPLPAADTFAHATDGRAYTVVQDAPTPRCPAPPQPVRLAPLGDCRPKDGPYVDPCAHTPRTILSIDRSGATNEPRSAAPAPTTQSTPHGGSCTKTPKPVHENPKTQKADKPATSITSRIMNTLRGGRGSTSPGRGGACAKSGAASRAGDAGWCNNPPPPAAAPPRCRPPSVTERLRRRPPSPCPRRHLHSSATRLSTESKPAGITREETIAAAKKLASALNERDQLNETGLGRCVRAPSCAPPPPKRPSGGALELAVPPGADTVCVRVSVGEACTEPVPTPPATDAPAKPCAKSGPAAQSTPHPCPPPAGHSGPRPAQTSCSDSWLSIKKLQKKISSSCGRSEPPSPGAGVPAAPPASPGRPGPSGVCSPQGRVKRAAALPHTIFIKS